MTFTLEDSDHLKSAEKTGLYLQNLSKSIRNFGLQQTVCEKCGFESLYILRERLN